MPCSWETPPNILVCILHVEAVTYQWSCGLRRLQIPGHFQEPHGVTGMPFDHARNECCKAALGYGADALFFLDSDVIPPPDAIWRLWRHNKPVISGLYCRRSPPWSVPVMIKNGTWHTNFVPGSIEEVDLVGAGCLLIRREVLEQMPPQRKGYHWFDWRVNFKDLPDIPPDMPNLSEDFTFNVHLKKTMNIPTLVDTSVHCLHVGSAQSSFGKFEPLGV